MKIFSIVILSLPIHLTKYYNKSDESLVTYFLRELNNHHELCRIYSLNIINIVKF